MHNKKQANEYHLEKETSDVQRHLHKVKWGTRDWTTAGNDWIKTLIFKLFEMKCSFVGFIFKFNFTITNANQYVALIAMKFEFE